MLNEIFVPARMTWTSNWMSPSRGPHPPWLRGPTHLVPQGKAALAQQHPSQAPGPCLGPPHKGNLLALLSVYGLGWPHRGPHPVPHPLLLLLLLCQASGQGHSLCTQLQVPHTIRLGNLLLLLTFLHARPFQRPARRFPDLEHTACISWSSAISDGGAYCLSGLPPPKLRIHAVIKLPPT